MIDAKKSNGVVLLVALLGGLGAGTAVVARKMSRTSKELDNLRADLSTVQKRDRLPPVVIQQLQAAPGAPEAPAASPPTEPTAAVPPERKLTREERSEKLRIFNEARLDLCARTFANQAKDPAWSTSAERLIRDKYAGAEFGSLAVATDCRSTMCKIEFSYSDTVSGPSAVQAMLSNHPWPSQQFTNFDLESKQGVSYLSREGNDVPQVNVPLR
jgi:hypothetical protein